MWEYLYTDKIARLLLEGNDTFIHCFCFAHAYTCTWMYLKVLTVAVCIIGAESCAVEDAESPNLNYSMYSANQSPKRLVFG